MEKEKEAQINSFLDGLTLEELEYCHSASKMTFWEKYHKKYRDVSIYPGSNITRLITDETGFECRHVPCEGYSAGRGTHKIRIPIEQYSEKLEQELIRKYDSL